jgi:hypothetical protein
MLDVKADVRCSMLDVSKNSQDGAAEVKRHLEYAAAYWERGHPFPLSAVKREKAKRFRPR